MIKVTLPNGVVVEGDSADLVGLLAPMVGGHVIADPAPTPEVRKRTLPASSDPSYPHRLNGNGKGCIKIGERQNQILSAAKDMARNAGNRYIEFKAADIAEMLGLELSIVSSALNNLSKVRVIRHGDNRCRWIITSRGWTAHFRITQPIRANS